VRVQGAVVRPATYELRAGESLDDLVKAAGGFTADASRRRIRVQRILPPSARTAEGSDRMVIDVASPNGSDDALGTVKLEAGDIVEVSRVSERVRGRIAVKGNVWQPGAQGVTPGTTLGEALRRAGGLKPDSYLGSVVVSRLKPDSTREQLRAVLRDTTGATVEPLTLQEDDEITVYSLTEFRAPRFVAISGAVLRPGQYQWRDGMTMRDLVLQAGGLAPSALLEQAEIARLPQQQREGTIAQAFRVKLDSSYIVGSNAATAPAAEIPLQVYDNVLILRQPDWQLQTTVVLTGEVRYPGTYSLMAKNERLSDLIKRAGGLTNNAYAAGVVFLRRSEGIGRVGVDLPQVIRDDDNRDNLLLMEGDSIHVPRFNALVEVSGAVNSPLAVPFEPGASLDHYIRAAGGSTRLADTKRAFVRQANGKVESAHRTAVFFKSSPKPTPGSQVIVPARDASEKRDLAQLLGTTAQVLGSLVTVVVVLSRTR
jgi:protein involved in polysaccharide export with SLBB domain